MGLLPGYSPKEEEERLKREQKRNEEALRRAQFLERAYQKAAEKQARVTASSSGRSQADVDAQRADEERRLRAYYEARQQLIRDAMTPDTSPQLDSDNARFYITSLAPVLSIFERDELNLPTRTLMGKMINGVGVVAHLLPQREDSSIKGKFTVELQGVVALLRREFEETRRTLKDRIREGKAGQGDFGDLLSCYHWAHEEYTLWTHINNVYNPESASDLPEVDEELMERLAA